MPRPNVSKVEPRRGGVMVPPGAYKCCIQRVYYDDATDSFKIVFDVVEGPYAGTYGNAPQANEFQHTLTVWFSKPDELDRSLGDLCTVDAWNPGFSARDAFQSGDDAAFVRRFCAIARRREVKEKKKDGQWSGEVSDFPNWWRLITPDEYNNGSYAEPRAYVQKRPAVAQHMARLEAEAAAARSVSEAVADTGQVPESEYESDIPF